jgi:DNA-binding NarL/FixJ family response regulator
MVGSIRKTRAEKKSSRHATRDEENSLELSQLELQVLERLRQGKTYKTIAHELNMSESTVELHIRHSLERIDAGNRSELLLLIKRFH